MQLWAPTPEPNSYLIGNILGEEKQRVGLYIEFGRRGELRGKISGSFQEKQRRERGKRRV